MTKKQIDQQKEEKDLDPYNQIELNEFYVIKKLLEVSDFKYYDVKRKRKPIIFVAKVLNTSSINTSKMTRFSIEIENLKFFNSPL